MSTGLDEYIRSYGRMCADPVPGGMVPGGSTVVPRADVALAPFCGVLAAVAADFEGHPGTALSRIISAEAWISHYSSKRKVTVL